MLNLIYNMSRGGGGGNVAPWWKSPFCHEGNRRVLSHAPFPGSCYFLECKKCEYIVNIYFYSGKHLTSFLCGY